MVQYLCSLVIHFWVFHSVSVDPNLEPRTLVSGDFRTFCSEAESLQGPLQPPDSPTLNVFHMCFWGPAPPSQPRGVELGFRSMHPPLHLKCQIWSFSSTSPGRLYWSSSRIVYICAYFLKTYPFHNCYSRTTILDCLNNVPCDCHACTLRLVTNASCVSPWVPLTSPPSTTLPRKPSRPPAGQGGSSSSVYSNTWVLTGFLVLRELLNGRNCLSHHRTTAVQSCVCTSQPLVHFVDWWEVTWPQTEKGLAGYSEESGHGGCRPARGHQMPQSVECQKVHTAVLGGWVLSGAEMRGS